MIQNAIYFVYQDHHLRDGFIIPLQKKHTKNILICVLNKLKRDILIMILFLSYLCHWQQIIPGQVLQHKKPARLDNEL